MLHQLRRPVKAQDRKWAAEEKWQNVHQTARLKSPFSLNLLVLLWKPLPIRYRNTRQLQRKTVTTVFLAEHCRCFLCVRAQACVRASFTHPIYCSGWLWWITILHVGQVLFSSKYLTRQLRQTASTQTHPLSDTADQQCHCVVSFAFIKHKLWLSSAYQTQNQRHSQVIFTLRVY